MSLYLRKPACSIADQPVSIFPLKTGSCRTLASLRQMLVSHHLLFSKCLIPSSGETWVGHRKRSKIGMRTEVCRNPWDNWGGGL